MSQCVICQVSIDAQARFCPSCGAEQPRSLATESESDPLIGHVVDGKYRIEHVLGVGGMGRVYRAVQLSLDKTIVIKILHDKYRDDDIIVQRFQREAKAASRLSHPNSIQIIDFGMEDKVLYMAMEYLDGSDLFQLFREEHPLGEERISHIMMQICTALGEAHQQNIIHRDLKPENIMIVNRSGQKDFVKVLDFGIAKILDPDAKEQTLTQVGVVCGTPEYMSPEQARGETLDPRSDIYALGVLLYQLCTGELPFKADTAVGLATKHILEHPTRPSQCAPSLRISHDIETIILRAMEKNPDQRFATVLEMADALLKHLDKAQGSLATMPEMSATPQTPSNDERKTQVTMGQHFGHNDLTEQATDSETAAPFENEPTTTFSKKLSADQTHLHSHELQALGHGKGTKVLLVGVVFLVAVGLAFLLNSDSEQVPAPPPPSPKKEILAKKPPSDSIPVVVAPQKKEAPQPVAKPLLPQTKPQPKSKKVNPSAKKSKPKSNRSLAESYYKKGNNLIAKGSLKKGLAMLQKSKKADASFVEAYRALAMAHKMNGDSKNACRSIKQFLKKKKLSVGRQSAYQKRFCQ